MEDNSFYRRNLPHLQPQGGTFFITFRLSGSIPISVIKHLQEEHREIMKAIEAERREKDGVRYLDLPVEMQEIRKSIYHNQKLEEEWQYFERYDDFLEKNLNEPHWLKQPDIAQLVAGSLHHWADRYYQLWAFCIMSNHVHLLLTQMEDTPILWKILQSAKKFSGIQANRILGRSGPFWEKESYDHLVRDSIHYQKNEFERILWYILNNPVKAGLVANWQDWEWSYCHPELLELVK